MQRFVATPFRRPGSNLSTPIEYSIDDQRRLLIAMGRGT